MALYTIGDLHLSLGCDKPMDIFDGWEGYLSKLEQNWQTLIQEDDTVVLVGDTSWAMDLENCYADFAFLDSLPGQKIVIKGNHDYWWNTLTKMNQYLQSHHFSSLAFLYNNAFICENVAICGSRSWLLDDSEPHDAKVMRREIGRLERSLQCAENMDSRIEKLVFLHYPPLYAGISVPEILDMLYKYEIKRCFYGHLHGPSIQKAVQGTVDGIEYSLVSADSLGFCPRKIETDVL